MQQHKRAIALELLSDAVRESQDGVRLQVRGVCMRPLVLDGDWVDLRPLAGRPQRGQLVLARDANGQLVCHRILGRDGNAWRLAGDRTFALENHPTESILGRVVAIERGDRHLSLAQRSDSSRRLDAIFAAWHALSYQRQRRFGGRLIEALRWRLVVLWHRWMWRSA